MRDEVNSWKDIDPDVQSTNVTVHTGWLKKLGGKFKTWRKRFFVLQGKNIYYYTNPEELRFLGEFPIDNAQIDIPGSTDTEFGGDTKGYVFIIKPKDDSEVHNASNQTFVLAAASSKERKEWIRAIRKVLYLKKGGALFGSSLDEVISYTKPEEDYLPRVVYESAAFIREHGLTAEGIFRKCGAQNVIQALAEAYDTATPGPILIPEVHNVHIAAGLMKYYLRELPEPVVPFAFYDRLKATGFKIQIGQDLDTVVDAIEMLPAPNYHLLQFLCQFLFEVSEYHEVNLMTIDNLASIFAPNILRQVDGDLDVEISAAPLINLTCAEFIRSHRALFRLRVSPSTQSGNTLFGSTRQRHQGNVRRRQMTMHIILPTSQSSLRADEKISIRDVDLLKSIHQESIASPEVRQLEYSPIFAATHSDIQNQESPSRSSGIGRSESSRTTRNESFSGKPEYSNTFFRESPDRQIRRNRSSERYGVGPLRRSQSVLHDPSNQESYFGDRVDSQLDSKIRTVPARNTSLSITPGVRHNLRIPKTNLVSYKSTWPTESLGTRFQNTKFNMPAPEVNWFQPKRFNKETNVFQDFEDYSGTCVPRTIQNLNDEVPPEPPPFDISSSETYGKPKFSSVGNRWYHAAQPLLYGQSNVFGNANDVYGSMHSSLDEFNYANRLEPEEQILYWRTVAVRARVEAASHQARAHALVNELNRLQCDLSMAELEIGLLRQRLTDTNSEPLTQARQHIENDLINDWSLYS